MQRGHVKVLLAVGFTLLVAGTIFFGLGRSQSSSNSIRATRPDSPRTIGGAGQTSAAVTSPSTRVTVAGPFRTRALRTIAPRRADRLAARADESEGAYALPPSKSQADAAPPQGPRSRVPSTPRH